MTDPANETPTAQNHSLLYQLDDATRIYQRGNIMVEALKSTNLTIKQGEFLAIEGPSGSGKSTLLQLLGALDTPTKGTIYFEGNNLSQATDKILTHIRSHAIGFIFQQFNLLPTLTAVENVSIAMAPRHLSKKACRVAACELLEQVGLGDRQEHLPSRLSGGEQQRVAIARALINDPQVIIADEPTGNLDSQTAQEITDLLIQLHVNKSVTIIFSTHDEEISRQAQRRIRLRSGEIIRDSLSPETP